MSSFLALLIFSFAYFFIATERVNKTVAALVGATLLLLLGIVEQQEAFFSEETGIDYNVIFLLIGMMVIVNITLKTGLFQWLAIRSAKIARGEPLLIMIILSMVTAVASAFLDNVTTVLLIAPVTILISQALKIDPVPLLIMEILSSNIGGTATLVGDPPNIMIASKAQLSFMDFISNLAPVAIIIMAAFLAGAWLIFRKHLCVSDARRQIIMQMDENEAITDPPLLRRCLLVLALTIAGFLLHGPLQLEPATIALAGAALLFLLSGESPHEILRDVEWPTIFFFIGLFIMVGALVKTGLISQLSAAVISLTNGNMLATSMFVMWFSAFASAIIDNIPYVATMNPLVTDMGRELWPGLQGTELLHNPELLPVWWSLALGACLGGNGTLVGASANVITAGMSERDGYPITFGRFLKFGAPLTVASVLIASLYVWLRYYVF